MIHIPGKRSSWVFYINSCISHNVVSAQVYMCQLMGYCCCCCNSVLACHTRAWRAGTPQSNTPGVYMPAMTEVEERSTFAMWVIMAAPLMLGCDIRNLTDNALGYLSNSDLVGVNQDAWALQGSLHQLTENGEQIYVKPLSDGSFAFALWNLAKTNATIKVEWSLFPDPTFASMHVRDLWEQRDLGTFAGSWTAMAVPGHGVAMIRATPAKPPPPPPGPAPGASQLMMAPCSSSKVRKPLQKFLRACMEYDF